MTKSAIKKIIGTSLLAILAAVTLLVASGRARALLIFNGDDLRATGTITSVYDSSFEFEPSGNTWPYTVIVNGATAYAGGYSSLDDLEVGDDIRVEANIATGDFVASAVRKLDSQTSYGNGCDEMTIQTAIFERPVNDFFYVTRDGLGIKIYFNNQTDFGGGTIDDLLPGTEVLINGQDCTQDGKLIAQSITIREGEGQAICDSFAEDAIVIRNQRPLLAHDQATAHTPLYETTIPAGIYNVTGVSWDNHTASPWDKEPNEQWKVIGFNNNARVYTSNNTDDLPTGIDYNTTLIGEDIEVGPLDHVQISHAFTPNSSYQSIYPICVAFEPVAESNNPAQIDEETDPQL